MTADIERILSHPTRLQRLRQLAILDSPQEASFDSLSRLATTILNVPTALVTIVDTDRQFFKSCIGLPEPWNSQRETPLSHSFCKHVVATAQPLIVDDARENPLVMENLAVRDMNVIAYLGIPLVLSDGVTLGSFCAIDSKPRHWTEREISIMTDLAGRVTTELELRDELLRRKQYEERQLHMALDREQDRMVKDFLQGASHEFRTALAVIKTQTHLLSRTSDNNTSQRYISSINGAVDSLTHLVENITDSANSNHKIPNLLQKYDLNTLLGVVTEEKMPHSQAKMLEVELLLDESVPAICCDPYQLSFAIGHVLDNAIEYSHANGTITLRTFEEDGFVVARIEDAGVGMSAEILPYIFQRFFRGDPARTKRGLGLGLSIAQSIVNRQGGEIVVQSAVNQGTQVDIRMPALADC